MADRERSQIDSPERNSADELDKSEGAISKRFDRIARRYDRVNDVVSMGQSRRWRRLTVAAIKPERGQRILDVAGGTGSSAAPLAAEGATVTICDISDGMVEVGRARHPEIEFIVGNAMELPFDGQTFDAATVSFGLRNMPDPGAALREIARVVKRGGALVVTEFSHPTHMALRAAYGPYLRFVLPAVAGLISGDRDSYEYFATSIKKWPNQHELAVLIADAGWADVEHRNLSGGIVAIHTATRA